MIFLKLPFVFSYTSTRMILAAMTALLLSIFLGPWFIRKLYNLKIGQPIRTEECPLLGELHFKKKDTPTMGGILVIFSLLISFILWGDLTSPFSILLLITTLILALVGGWDDYLKLKHKKNSKGLSGRKKLFFQALTASIVAAYFLVPEISAYFGKGLLIKDGDQVLSLTEYAGRLYLPFLKEPWLIFSSLGLLIPFGWMLFVIVGSSNAVNLTDGLDGLAAGLLILSAATLAIFAYLSSYNSLADYLNILYVEDASEIGVFLAAMSGALLGFLWYNGFPAQVFMGDIGSLALGGIIGVSAVMLKREVLLSIVGGIFVIEALSVIGQVISYRYFDKKRIFLCAPLHHHFEYKGWPETKVVIRFWIIGLLLALIGLSSLKFQ